MWWVINTTPRPFYLKEREPVPILQEVGWAPEPLWTDAKNLTQDGLDPRTVQALASHYPDPLFLLTYI